MHLGLERIKRALKDLGGPSQDIPAIQIIGTNGKGSIASFLQSIFKIANIHTGVYTSPHLISWCERIQVDKELISPTDLRTFLTKIKQIAEKHKLTPFEYVTATAFDYFSTRNVDLLVLEAGLGGRLDATSIHPNRKIIAIASIGLDHCQHLGNSLQEISKEKTAAIPNDAIVISGPQHPQVAEIIQKETEIKKATLKWVSKVPKEWKLGLRGEIQRQNAAVAKAVIEAISLIGWNISKEEIKTGLSQASWPGRMQFATWRGLPVVIDGAHNPHAAKQLSIERAALTEQDTSTCWILGIQSHKQGPEILRYLLKPGDKAWIVPIPGHSHWQQRQLSEACQDLKNQLISAKSAEDALCKIFSMGHWPSPPPLIAGSLYLLGNLLATGIIKQSSQ